MGLRAPALVKRAALACVALACVACPPYGKRVAMPRGATLDPAVTSALQSSYASERSRAAFQLGQLGIAWDPAPVAAQVEADFALAERLYRERDPGVRTELVAALGRVGRERGRRALLAELEQSGARTARAGWALAHLYRRLRGKGFDPTPDVAVLGRALIAPEADVRAAVTDALCDMDSDAARPLLLRELTDQNGVARARAARGLIGHALVEDVPALAHALSDPDERVAAAAALALADMAEKGRGVAQVTEVLEREREMLTRPAVLIALSEREIVSEQLAPVLMKVHDLLKRAGQGALACLAALSHDRMSARPMLVPDCGGGAVTELARLRLRARVLGESDVKRAHTAVDELLALPQVDAQLRALVAAALVRFDDPRAKVRVLALLDDGDLFVRASAAEAASGKGWTEAGPAILRALPERVPGAAMSPDEIDAAIALLTALTALHPEGTAARVRPYLDGTPAAIALAARAVLTALGEQAIMHPATPHGPYDELALPDGPILVQMETDRGTIRIDVRADVAPKTARNFIGLLKKGFYDGLTFHRIVPGFVAQGGDPRGDGSGGAGHFIACEPNAMQYREGTVGMALSGLDTGSSQFFIALAPAPHLEGKYTAFAQVVDGMAVARSLQPGDHIRSLRIVSTAP